MIFHLLLEKQKPKQKKAIFAGAELPKIDS